MSRRTRKGQGFILILIVFLVIVAVFALLSMHSARVSSAPTVQEAFWRISGQNVTVGFVGFEVEAHVVVKAREEYVGSIVMKIRKDISYWPDSDYSTKPVLVNLRGDQVTELELRFVPDQASAGRLRGYFIEVDFSVTHTSWVMESSYPPRLKVSESPNF